MQLPPPNTRYLLNLLELYIFFDEVDHIAGRRARRKYLSDTSLFECRNVAIGDNTAADNQGIGHAVAAYQVNHFREEMAVCTGQDAHGNNINVFLQGSFGNLFRSLAQARIDNFKTSITQGTGNYFCTAVMAIKACAEEKFGKAEQ